MDSNIKKIIGLIILILIIGGGIYIFFYQKKETKSITYSTSDAGKLKGDISIALDSWIGYFPFRSPVFGKLMRDEGYRLKIIDDNADYPARMSMLKNDEINFAVCTVDSYILNGNHEKYPGAIIAIIDESKGGDAVLAWKDKIPNIDMLKSSTDFKIAFTPGSPSEHLIKAISVHFGIPILSINPERLFKVNGAEEAYKKLMAKSVDIAVMWEPHVTEALANKDIIKLLGSEDVENLIVDILLVNRKFAGANPEIITLFLKKYFETLAIYSASNAELSKDIATHTKLSEKQIEYMLKGVRWMHYPENVNWFGLNAAASYKLPELVDSIESTVKILIESGDFPESPLAQNDPYTIINSSFIKELYNTMNTAGSDIPVEDDTSLVKRYKKLPDNDWLKLKTVGSLKLRSITFRSGTSTLDENGIDQVKDIVSSIKHYPNFRILVKGHSGIQGDPNANRSLSAERAESVKKDLQFTYNIDPNRIKVTGAGSDEPLIKQENESDRSYNNRLKRVEILFLSGD